MLQEWGWVWRWVLQEMGAAVLGATVLGSAVHMRLLPWSVITTVGLDGHIPRLRIVSPIHAQLIIMDVNLIKCKNQENFYCVSFLVFETVDIPVDQQMGFLSCGITANFTTKSRTWKTSQQMVESPNDQYSPIRKRAGYSLSCRSEVEPE